MNLTIAPANPGSDRNNTDKMNANQIIIRRPPLARQSPKSSNGCWPMCASIAATARTARSASSRSAAKTCRSWQWLFPSTLICGQYRWHATDECVGTAMRAAVNAAGIIKRVTPHTLRHAFVTYGLRCGNDIKTMMDLVGHEDPNTTMIYAHGDSALGVSPMDVIIRPLAAAQSIRLLNPMP